MLIMYVKMYYTSELAIGTWSYLCILLIIWESQIRKLGSLWEKICGISMYIMYHVHNVLISAPMLLSSILL